MFKILSLEGLVILSWEIDLTFCLLSMYFPFRFNYYLLNESEHEMYPPITFS